jgi:glycogen debranching enzyme
LRTARSEIAAAMDTRHSPWNPSDEPVVLDPAGALTLVDGTTFCLSGRDGDFDGGAHGLFFADLRALSRLRLSVDSTRPQPMASAADGSDGATFVLRTLPASRSGPRLMIVRRRRLFRGMAEQIEVRNHSPQDRTVELHLDVDTDFADLFAVKEGRPATAGHRDVELGDATILFDWQLDGRRRRVRVRFEGAPELSRAGATWRAAVPARSSWTVGFSVEVALGDGWSSPTTVAVPDGDADDSWVRTAPQLRTSHPGLAIAYERSIADLAALRLFDPIHGGPPVVAAGAPWFMTLFGRDSILTSWMALPVDPTLGYGVARALADLQGRVDDADTEEEPGRVLHEVRFVSSTNPSIRDGRAYYGTVDATPLFVMLVGELSRWGLPDHLLVPLLEAVDRAMDWIVRRMDGGYLTYQRTTPHGLANQGWKDSWDGIRYHDGRVATAPIALCEVQGYVYAAHRARAELARRFGELERAEQELHRADDLKARFNRDFWCPEHGWLAIGLDAHGGRIDALASNMGHCLWTGIVDEEHADAVVTHLTSTSMWSGWGVRTLASAEPGYDPTSYHCGSVWPHDTAVAVAGLVRYGYAARAHAIVLGLLDAAQAGQGRLPELLCGIDRDDIRMPVPYPTSCSPQAWAAAAPLLLLRALLGLDPDVPTGTLAASANLPAELGEVHLRGARLWHGHFDVRAERNTIEIDAHALRSLISPR